MGRAVSSLAITAHVADEASKPMQDIGEATASSAEKITALNSATELAGKAWSLLTGIIGTGVGVLVNATKAAMEAEKTQRDLATALKTHGANVDELMPKLNAQASAIQRMTGLSGDNVVALQAQLAAMGVLPENIEAATVASIGWAKTTGKDMAGAAMDVTKALNGKFTALDKLGIKVDSSDGAIREMARGFALAAADGESLEGKLRLLTEDWGDLEEAVGAAVTESEAAGSAVSVASASVVQLQEVFASPEGKGAVNTFFKALAGGAAAALNAGLGVLTFWEEEVMPRINNARVKWDQVFGDNNGVIVETLDVNATAASAKMKEIAQNLADSLQSIGAGQAPTLPEIKLPDIPAIKRQQGEDDKLDDKAEKEALADEKRFEEAVRREIEHQERMDAQEVQTEARRKQIEEERAASILELTERVEAGKRAIVESNLQRMEETEQRTHARLQEEAAGIVAMFESVGNGIANTWEANFSQVGKIIDGQMVTTSKAFGNFLADIGKQIAAFLASRIVMTLLKLLGGALAGGPLGGLVEFLGFSEGGPVQKMAGGGFVSGGTPGVDSVPALLMPGEYVLPVDLVDAIRSGAPPGAMSLDRPMAFAAGGAVPTAAPQSARGGAHVTVVAQMLTPPDVASWEGIVERQVASAMERAVARGALPWLTPGESTG